MASFAGAPTSGAHLPGDPAGAAQPASPVQAIPARAMALVAYGTPAQPRTSPQPRTSAQATEPAKAVKAADKPVKPPRPHPHRHRHRHHRRPGHRPRRHRHHKDRQLRHRHHRGRHHHRHAGRHRIYRLPRQPQRIAWSLLAAFHWQPRQFRYLDLLWVRESGWNRFACNPYSGAYGIPQALPASKMASAGPNWRTNARTQIVWGMGYIRGRYVTPYRAWLHEVHYGWY